MIYPPSRRSLSRVSVPECFRLCLAGICPTPPRLYLSFRLFAAPLPGKGLFSPSSPGARPQASRRCSCMFIVCGQSEREIYSWLQPGIKSGVSPPNPFMAPRGTSLCVFRRFGLPGDDEVVNHTSGRKEKLKMCRRNQILSQGRRIK